MTQELLSITNLRIEGRSSQGWTQIVKGVDLEEVAEL